VSRAAVWWERVLRDPVGGYTPLWCLWPRTADPQGYALYAGDNRRVDEDGLTGRTQTIRELVAAYLGGTRTGSLAAAGLVTKHRAGPLVRPSAVLTWDPAPWCPTTS
jgi:hypothetical protein